MSAWTVDALEAVKAELEGNARLASYVDTVIVRSRLRDDEAPALTRHAILIAPGGKTVTRDTTTTSLESLSLYLRLFVLPWDPADEEDLLTADTVVGVGTSEVGIYQFAEDVSNALRSQEFGILESTATECDVIPDLSRMESEAWDTAVYTVTLVWTGQRIANHDPSLR